MARQRTESETRAAAGDVDAIETSLLEQGWAVVDLPDPAPVHEARALLLEHLRAGPVPGLEDLEGYHRFVTADEDHVEIWHELSEWFWREDLSRDIIVANLDLFRRLLGPDLHLQRYPYLRAVRPDREGEAAPIHRDTYYGSSPYELVALIPFTDVAPESAMRVVTGSHIASDAEFPYTQTENPDVPVRSKKHRLGYSYAPRLLAPELRSEAEPVPLRVGQALLFVLSLVHGGGDNGGDRTRFSADIRLVNSLVGVPYSRGVHDDYYVPLCSSAVSRVAERYLAVNRLVDGADGADGAG